MLDLTSLVREKIFRLSPLMKKPVAGEELSEKRTTKMGYFLLICMFFAVMVSSQWALNVISEIPTIPNQVPYCVNEMIQKLSKVPALDLDSTDGYRYYSGYNDCTLISTTPSFDFKTQYDALKPKLDEVKQAQENISQYESEKSQSQYRQDTAQQDYNTSLHEKTAEIDQGIYDSQNLQNNIEDTRNKISDLESKIQEEEGKISQIRDEVAPQVLALIPKYQEANRAYASAFLFYRLFCAFLSLFYALSVFLVLYRMYVRNKIKNSPATIIFSVATFAYGLIVLQIGVWFLWDILPHKLVNLIVEFLGSFTPLLYLVQFIWPFIIVGFFGFLVFRIQKRLYAPSNVLKRFVSDRKCPNCGNAVDTTKPFCPLCSHEIQIHCSHCQALTVKGMPYCSSCGGKIEESGKTKE